MEVSVKAGASFFYFPPTYKLVARELMIVSFKHFIIFT